MVFTMIETVLKRVFSISKILQPISIPLPHRHHHFRYAEHFCVGLMPQTESPSFQRSSSSASAPATMQRMPLPASEAVTPVYSEIDGISPSAYSFSPSDHVAQFGTATATDKSPDGRRRGLRMMADNAEMVTSSSKILRAQARAIASASDCRSSRQSRISGAQGDAATFSG